MYSHIEGTAFRRTLAVVAITALMVVGLAAAPALAEPPETHTDPATFDGIDNPCTGVAFEATGTVTVSIHEMHNGMGIVGVTTATGTSSDGYELTSRKHRFVRSRVSKGVRRRADRDAVVSLDLPLAYRLGLMSSRNTF